MSAPVVGPVPISFAPDECIRASIEARNAAEINDNALPLRRHL